MKNPLIKRLPRELFGEFGKYLVIFLFMTGTIGFVSGFLVAGGSIETAYDESFEKYNIENGHFILDNELDNEIKTELEKDGVRIYEDYYLEEGLDTDNDNKENATVRIYKNRKEVNKVCLMKGHMPSDSDEIAIDRMFAVNNKLNPGDEIVLNGHKLKITGYVALSDYSALFSNNTDLMFDAVKFGVAIMTDEGVRELEDTNYYYNYSFKYTSEPEDVKSEKKISDEFMIKLAAKTDIRSYVPRYANSAINFTGDDMGGDKTMITVLLYILIVILAFVFSITINHSITKESAVIGTLRASGYTRREIMVHYLAIPMCITFISAIIGNILGYTVLKQIVADLYYNSYSLTTYETIWNSEAFVLTTVIPMIIMAVTNIYTLYNKLKLSPLKFIRRDLAKKKNKKAVRLPDFKFFSRFRLRIILQNRANYVVLFIGILFSNILLLFGLMMNPLLDDYEEKVINNMTCKYQYILKVPVETNVSGVEKYSVTSLKNEKKGFKEEEISVYGCSENSRYLAFETPDKGVAISNGLAEKYKYKKGDIINLKEAYGENTYEFEITDIVDYPASLGIFMKQKNFNKIFSADEEYFNGYFSNEKLTDINNEAVASCISEDDLTKVSRQLRVSMGSMFQLIKVFAAILTAMLVYLLSKIIIEKNATSISMIKILGYENREISKLYILSTAVVVIISEILSIILSDVIIKNIYWFMMKDYSGWLSFSVRPVVYVEMFAIIIGVYAVVTILQVIKIKKIPMDEALKNVE